MRNLQTFYLLMMEINLFKSCNCNRNLKLSMLLKASSIYDLHMYTMYV